MMRVKYICRTYVRCHLNPVKIIEPRWRKIGLKNLPAIKEFLLNYHFSSYLDYLRQPRLQNKILNKQAFPEYFSKEEEVENEMMDWLSFDDV